MNQSVKETVRYYLMFTVSTSKHWVFRWLDSDIQHVYAMTLSPAGQFWIVVDPLMSHLRPTLLPVSEFPYPYVYDPGAIIIPVTSIINLDNVVHGIGLFSCVSIVKALLGIKNRFILTPYQLYTYLRRRRDGK